MRSRLWKIWALAGGLVVNLHYTLLPRIPHATDVAYFLLSAAVVVALLVGVRLHRPERPGVWYLLAAGQAAIAIGDGIWETLTITTHGNVPYPSAADPFYLLAYPLWVAALVLATRRRRANSERGGAVDAAIVMVGLSMLSFVFLMRPYIEDPSAGLFSKIITLAYPVGDLFLIGMVAPLVGKRGGQTLSHRLLMGWLLLYFVVDTVYAVAVIQGWYVAGSWVDAGWLIAYVLLGAAALHPSMAATSRRDAARSDLQPLGSLRVVILATASLAGPAVLIVEAILHDTRNIDVLAAGCFILAALVVKRLTGLVREADARRLELSGAMGQLSHQALHDPLTGLANRTLFADRIEHAAARSRRRGLSAAVLLLDLDDFKAVNDGMGHAVGDALLIAVARRIQDASRETDTGARLGGDEFAILVEDFEDPERPAEVAERVLSRLGEPFDVSGHTVFASASIGIALHDSATTDTDTLRQADVAMYMAKRSGKGRFVVFEPEMGHAAFSRVRLEADLRRALEPGANELQIHYQPIVRLGTERIRGVEALVRWDHPSRGMMGPAEFLSMAEETGLIVPLGRLVLREACRQVAEWRRTIPGVDRLTVSVNLSSKEVEDPQLLDYVEAAMSRARLEPEALILELSEDLLLRDVGTADQALGALANLGVRLSVDDFGARNSSMASLKRFPITQLKIDKSYVDSLATGSDSSLVQGIIALGKAVHLELVAEGIEDPAQASLLLHMGCESGQGYLFARPQSADLIGLVLLEHARTDEAERLRTGDGRDRVPAGVAPAHD
jgi:diguanylate cyclase (GGDEF)-like protein